MDPAGMDARIDWARRTSQLIDRLGEERGDSPAQPGRDPQGTREWAEELPGEEPPDQRTVPAPGSMEHRVTMLEARLENHEERLRIMWQQIRLLESRISEQPIATWPGPEELARQVKSLEARKQSWQDDCERIVGKLEVSRRGEYTLQRALEKADKIDELMVDAMRDIRSKLLAWVLKHALEGDADASIVLIDMALKARDVARHKDEL